jgi:hypothetical protein
MDPNTLFALLLGVSIGVLLTIGAAWLDNRPRWPRTMRKPL